MRVGMKNKMAPDLIDNSKVLHYLNDSGEWREIKGTLNCGLKDSEPTYYTVDFDSSPSASTSETFDFKFNTKAWYRIGKALGLVKPIYKKKRKGKRYVWYEVI